MEELVPPSPETTPHKKSNIVSIALIMLAFIIGGIAGYIFYPAINKSDSTTDKLINEIIDSESNVKEPDLLITNSPSGTTGSESPFCKQYGTYEVPKKELLEEYTTGVGDTLRSIAKNKLEDETKALELIDTNPSLIKYEVDDDLPMRMKLYLPNDKYNEPNISAYIKARGNISFNKEKPMFGINAPNSGTGPFTISDNIKDDLKGINEGDCVDMIYGSRGFDPQKVVMEVSIQK